MAHIEKYTQTQVVIVCRPTVKFTHTTPILKSLHWLKIN